MESSELPGECGRVLSVALSESCSSAAGFRHGPLHPPAGDNPGETQLGLQPVRHQQRRIHHERGGKRFVLSGQFIQSQGKLVLASDMETGLPPGGRLQHRPRPFHVSRWAKLKFQ